MCIRDRSYRHSCIFEKNYVVLSARFSFEKGESDKIKARMDELAKARREKQPLEFPSAGSTFKRPEGYFAGKLIQDAGLKGYTAVSYTHLRMVHRRRFRIVSFLRCWIKERLKRYR